MQPTSKYLKSELNREFEISGQPDAQTPTLQHGGATLVNRWQELFESYRSTVDYELHDLSITSSDDVAFSHSLNRISGTMKSGRKTDVPRMSHALNRPTTAAITIFNSWASIGLPRWAW